MQYLLLIILSALGNHNSFPNYESVPILDLSRHLWNDRVLLIITEEDNSDDYKTQLNILLNDKKGMSERKLVYYTITPTHYQYMNNSAIESDLPWNIYRKSSPALSVQLIGLDGGIKVQRDAPIQAEELFTIIDGMPMRRSELRRKKNK